MDFAAELTARLAGHDSASISLVRALLKDASARRLRRVEAVARGCLDRPTAIGLHAGAVAWADVDLPLSLVVAALVRERAVLLAL